jgi:hypothetical protein
MPKKANAMLLGFLTIVPAIYAVFFIGVWFAGFFSLIKFSPSFLVGLFIAHFAIICLLFALAIYYIRHVYRNETLKPEERPMWVLLLVFVNVISMPMYWQRYVWRAPSNSSGANIK